MRVSGIGKDKDTKADFRSFGLLYIIQPQKITLGKSSAGGKGTGSAPGEGGTTQIPTLSQRHCPRTHERQPRRPRFATMGAPSVHQSQLLNGNRPDLTQRVSPRISSQQLRRLELTGVTEALITVITH